MNDLWQEVKQSWIREDYQYLIYLKKQLIEFNKLYLKHFDKPSYREINIMVIQDLKKELEALNARLYHNKAGSRRIRYRLARNTTKAG